jgi:hypothetical protein
MVCRQLFAAVQQWLFDESVVQPLMFALGAGQPAGDWPTMPRAGCWWACCRSLVMLAVIGPLAALAAGGAGARPRAVRVDVIYTLIHRLGLFKLVMFFTLDPLADRRFGELRVAGVPTFHLDQLWPGVTDGALVSFMIYLVVFDFADYWLHRAQHQFNWWWALHALHHAQRQMTMWSDNRNHLLDDVLRDLPVGAAGASDRRGAGPVRGAGGHHPAQRELPARQPAPVVWPHRRAAVGQPALSPPAPQRGHRARVWQAKARSAGTTSACCCPGGTCCLAPPTSSTASTHRRARPGGAGARLRRGLLGAAVALAAETRLIRQWPELDPMGPALCLCHDPAA